LLCSVAAELAVGQFDELAVGDLAVQKLALVNQKLVGFVIFVKF